MRRIPPTAALLALAALAGCNASKPYHNMGLGRPAAADPMVAPTSADSLDDFGKPAGPKTTVSDAVMIGEQGEQGYRDSLAPF